VLLENPAQPSSPLAAAPNKLHPCFLLERANSIFLLLLDPLIEHTTACVQVKVEFVSLWLLWMN
jgi:hypothetical protein